MIIKSKRFSGCFITLNEINHDLLIVNIKTNMSEQAIPFRSEDSALEYFNFKSKKIAAEQKKTY